MPIISSTPKYFTTLAGVNVRYQEDIGATAEGQFYFVVPENADFQKAISLMGINPSFPGRSKKKAVFASTLNELKKLITNIITTINNVKKTTNTYIFYKNNSKYYFYRNKETGDITPVFNEHNGNYEIITHSKSISYGRSDIDYSISLKVAIVNETTYEDDSGNKNYRYVLTPDEELDEAGKKLNAYARNQEWHYIMTYDQFKGFERLPLTEENAAFFTKFFDSICKFNNEIHEKLNSEILQSIIQNNIPLLGGGK